MKKIAIATLALGAAMSSFSAVPAHATVLSPFGFLCGFASGTDPGAEPGTQTGAINAGPLVLDDGATPPGVYSGNFVCTVQVGSGNSTHAGTDAAVVTGANGTAVIAAAGQVSYSAGATDPVYLCTQVNVDGNETLYYNDSNDPLVDGSWSTTNSANCGLATSAGSDDANPIEVLIDSIICPVLAIVFPPEGDIVLPDPIGKIWDCPPYDA